VLLASLLDGASLDLLAPFPDAITSPEVDVNGGEIVQALVIAAVIVMLDKVGNGPFEVVKATATSRGESSGSSSARDRLACVRPLHFAQGRLDPPPCLGLFNVVLLLIGLGLLSSLGDGLVPMRGE